MTKKQKTIPEWATQLTGVAIIFALLLVGTYLDLWYIQWNINADNAPDSCTSLHGYDTPCSAGVWIRYPVLRSEDVYEGHHYLYTNVWVPNDTLAFRTNRYCQAQDVYGRWSLDDPDCVHTPPLPDHLCYQTSVIATSIAEQRRLVTKTIDYDQSNLRVISTSGISGIRELAWCR